jgi:hypothetical protein
VKKRRCTQDVKQELNKSMQVSKKKNEKEILETKSS